MPFKTDNQRKAFFAQLNNPTGAATTPQNLQKAINKNPQLKNMDIQELKKRGIFLKHQGDADKDGIKNIKDCKPLNSKKHQIALITPAVQVEKMEKGIRAIKEKIKEKIHLHKLKAEGSRRALAITKQKEAKHTQQKLQIERDIAKSNRMKEKAEAELKELHKGKFKKFLEKPSTGRFFKKIGKVRL